VVADNASVPSCRLLNNSQQKPQQGGELDCGENGANRSPRNAQFPQCRRRARLGLLPKRNLRVRDRRIHEFQDALRLDEKNGNPDDALMHYHLGLAYRRANQISSAREQLAKAIKLNPDYAEARKALGELGDEVTKPTSAAQQ